MLTEKPQVEGPRGREFGLILSTSVAGLAQNGIGVDVGIKAQSLTDKPLASDRTSFSYSLFTVGPMVELKLPHRLSIEFNAFRRRYTYRTPGADYLIWTPSSGGFRGIVDTS